MLQGLGRRAWSPRTRPVLRPGARPQEDVGSQFRRLERTSDAGDGCWPRSNQFAVMVFGMMARDLDRHRFQHSGHDPAVGPRAGIGEGSVDSSTRPGGRGNGGRADSNDTMVEQG
jgi:hypothetical protein